MDSIWIISEMRFYKRLYFVEQMLVKDVEDEEAHNSAKLAYRLCSKEFEFQTLKSSKVESFWKVVKL